MNNLLLVYIVLNVLLLLVKQTCQFCLGHPISLPSLLITVHINAFNSIFYLLQIKEVNSSSNISGLICEMTLKSQLGQELSKLRFYIFTQVPQGECQDIILQ
jgi:hypothetical protein